MTKRGTDPDVEIDNAPQDAAANRDVQLETALSTALKSIETAVTTKPEFGPRPNLARKGIPK